MPSRIICITYVNLIALAFLAGCDAGVQSTATQVPASPTSTRPPPPTPTESLCPPDLEYSVSSYYDEDLNLIMVISAPGQIEPEEIYWCWSEITTHNMCTCRPQSDSNVECRVAARENVEEWGFEDTALIDVGMGGYSDCRLFYHDLKIPPFPQ
jgi:hypothetical protein